MKHLMAICTNHSNILYFCFSFSFTDWYSMMCFDKIHTYLTVYSIEIKSADLAIKMIMFSLE